MVKHATMRLYKKRASKKRRTIRKLKRTMRRKMQRGGNGSLGLVAPLVVVLLILFGNNPVLKGFFEILQVFIGGQQNGGNKRLNQMGGGKLSEALAKFGDGIAKDTHIPISTKKGLIDCINKMTSKSGISDNVIEDMNEVGPEDANVKRGGGLGLFDKFDKFENLSVIGKQFGNVVSAASTAAQQKATSVASAVQQKATSVASAASTAASAVKDNGTKKFMDEIAERITKGKALFIAKVSHMKDEGNRNCMKIILSFGFQEAKNQLSSVSAENITNAIAAKAALAKKTGAELWSKVRDVVKPSSTPLPGNGGVIQEHIIKIEKQLLSLGSLQSSISSKSLKEATDRDSASRNFMLFEGKLRTELQSKGWPTDKTKFGEEIIKYNNVKIMSLAEKKSGIRSMTGRDEIFNVGLFSGMITSIEFTYKDAGGEIITKNINISGESEGLIGKKGFFTLYPSMGTFSSYQSFKNDLIFNILPNTGNLTRYIDVKITTDFSKTPDYSSVQRDALKAANIETVEYYRSVNQKKVDANSKVDNAQQAVNRFGMAYTKKGEQQKLNLEKTLAEAKNELKTAETYADNAFQRADTAFKAALNAGIPEKDLVHPQNSK